MLTALVLLMLNLVVGIVIYGGVELCLHAFLTSALNGSELSASGSGCFTPVRITPITIG